MKAYDFYNLHLILDAGRRRIAFTGRINGAREVKINSSLMRLEPAPVSRMVTDVVHFSHASNTVSIL